MAMRQVSVLKTKRYAGDVEKILLSFLWIKKKIIAFYKDRGKRVKNLYWYTISSWNKNNEKIPCKAVPLAFSYFPFCPSQEHKSIISETRRMARGKSDNWS